MAVSSNYQACEALSAAVHQDDSKRVVTLANQADFISFRHHTFEQPRGVSSVQLTECGPRFELKLYQVRAVAGLHGWSDKL